MKKIVNTDEKIILTYGLKGERMEIFESHAKKRNFKILTVQDEETYCQVENLIYNDIEECRVDTADAVDIEFLLFINIINDDLYDFLGELKKAGQFFPNKAILTETNLKWKLRRLLQENKEEHVVMTMFFNLRRAMKKAEILVEKNLHDDKLIEIMKRAEHFMNPREFDFDEMKEIHNELAMKVNDLQGV